MSRSSQSIARSLLVRENCEAQSAELAREYEGSLLSDILSRNGRDASACSATPPGYSYERAEAPPATGLEADGPVMQIAAHPGDSPDFFYATWLKLAANPQYRQNYHEILLTDGEKGVEGWHPEYTRRVRIEETYTGAEVVGSKLHFLGYPDGELADLSAREREQLIVRLAHKIREVQPAILVVHPPRQDHPDHAASFLLTLGALERQASGGGRLPTLLTHDVEFGLQQPGVGSALVNDSDPTGNYPLYAPGLIVDISSTHQTAQQALRKHRTQMLDPLTGRPKLYADLIDTLARLRGLQCLTGSNARPLRGQGFSHVIIPGVTNEHNFLLPRLSAGSIYTLTHRLSS